MRNLKILFGLALLALALIVGWQIGAAVLANVELHDDMQDLASQLSLHVGLDASISDDQFRAAAVNKATRYGDKAGTGSGHSAGCRVWPLR
jgi:hypothetical protein